jgi:hypothetical protein
MLRLSLLPGETIAIGDSAILTAIAVTRDRTAIFELSRNGNPGSQFILDRGESYPVSKTIRLYNPPVRRSGRRLSVVIDAPRSLQIGRVSRVEFPAKAS